MLLIGVLVLAAKKNQFQKIYKKILLLFKIGLTEEDWVEVLAKDPATYSSTSICFKIYSSLTLKNLDEENVKNLVK